MSVLISVLSSVCRNVGFQLVDKIASNAVLSLSGMAQAYFGNIHASRQISITVIVLLCWPQITKSACH